jgi:putative endonuclease
MNYTVYILRSERDSRRYIGFTNNLEERFLEHQYGLVKSTKNRRPLKVIYTEEFEKKSDALAREKFFKSGKGREFLKNKLKI